MKQAYFLFACLCVLGFAEIYAQSPVLLKEINPSGGSYGYEGSVVLGNKLLCAFPGDSILKMFSAFAVLGVFFNTKRNNN